MSLFYFIFEIYVCPCFFIYFYFFTIGDMLSDALEGKYK